MIDSVFPCKKVTDRYPQTVDEVELVCPLPQQLSDQQKVLSLSCLLQGHNMLREWRPPSFTDPSRPTPPAVLLQATGKVYGENSETTHYFDLVRHTGSLGWEEYNQDFFTACLEIPGHHFSVFDDAHVRPTMQCSNVRSPSLTLFQCPEVTRQLRNACALLEKKRRGVGLPLGPAAACVNGAI
ncbi:hypothetical protein VTO42DRAFT_443 [Malbranchea cinnamomea]